MGELFIGCGAQTTVTSTDWAAVPDHTDPRSFTVMVLGILPDAVRELFEDDGGGLFGIPAHSGMVGSGVVVVRRIAGELRPFIVTNRHVVRHVVTTKIKFDSSPTLYDADVVYVAPYDDLAVLAPRLRPEERAPFATGVGLETLAPKESQAIVAIGFPVPDTADPPPYTVSSGTVSLPRMRIDSDVYLAPYIKHTARVAGGSSGGPLLSDRGRLLGINTQRTIDGSAFSLSIPAERVTHALDAVEGSTKDDAGRSARLACLSIVGALSDEKDTLIAEYQLAGQFLAEVGLPIYRKQLRALSAGKNHDAVAAFERDLLGQLARLSFASAKRSLRDVGGLADREICDDVSMKGDGEATCQLQATRGSAKLRLLRETGVWTIAALDVGRPSAAFR